MDTHWTSSQNIFATRSLSSANQKCSDSTHVLFTSDLFIGSASLSLESNVKTAVENCYSSVVAYVVHIAKPMLSPATKDLLPALQKSSVIYEYKCHRDNRYVGRTSQQLQDSIKQHVPKWLIQHHTTVLNDYSRK